MKWAVLSMVATTLCITGQRTFAGNTGPAGDSTSRSTSTETARSSDVSDSPSSQSLEAKLISALPPWIGDGLEIETWGWFSDLQNDQSEYDNAYDVELSLGVTKSFNQRFVLSGQGNFIDANGTRRGELEQGYGSFILNENQGSFLTVGKFNANFGIEGRDFWNRTTGTTSLLFGAQPQDLVGLMLTQPIGQTGMKLRPFLTEDFQGQLYFNQSPYAGLNMQYQPVHELSFGVTGMVGPGFVLDGGRPIHSPYPQDAYGDSYSVIGNWQGPNLYAESGGTMYLVEATASWQIRPDLRLSAECLQESTHNSNGSFGWFGFLAQADYDLTDRWHFFGRWSYLNDANWIVTGTTQRAQELSGGAGYRVFDGVEVRGEYRHDMSNVVGDVNSVSIHLTFTY